MKKTFFFIFFCFLFILFLMCNFNYAIFVKPSFMFLNMSIFPLDFSIFMDKESFYFMFMVFLVSSMVLLYSEFYMDHGNMKKFYFVTMLFLSSMIFLCISGSYILMMLGWDLLGLSSLFLIMFYPAKTPMFNSLMTFFYNRLGDCFMILIICFMVNNSSLFLSNLYKEDLFFVLLLFIFCSLAKSAQFPLSSWLPAAMSAPTPISAMVHSSTLVTAGIFIIYKFFYFLGGMGLTSILMMISSMTFLIAGFMGSGEFDLKKIVAFSTMSQISMIILFCSSGFLVLSMTHMIFHAFFKTLMFCCCGILFVWHLGDQLMKIFGLTKNSSLFLYFLFISIFCMSGLPFSSAFYSKDLYLEHCISESVSFKFICSMIGSVMTIFYSTKIFSMFYNTFTYMVPCTLKKKYFFLFFIFFSVMTLLVPYFSQFFLLKVNFPIIYSLDLYIILSILIASMVFYVKLPPKVKGLSMELFFAKFFLFGNFGKLFLLDDYSVHFNDHLIFKPMTFFKFNMKFSSSWKSIMLFCFYLSLYFLWF